MRRGRAVLPREGRARRGGGGGAAAAAAPGGAPLRRGVVGAVRPAAAGAVPARRRERVFRRVELRPRARRRQLNLFGHI